MCCLPQVDIIQMHGTGTGLGDPVENGAVAAVFGSDRKGHTSSDAGTPLALITSKSTLGHAEPAAGVVGVLHTMKALQQEVLPPLVHLRTINPFVAGALAPAHNSSSGSFHLPRQLSGRTFMSPQPSGAWTGLVAGVSSFAFQGEGQKLK